VKHANITCKYLIQLRYKKSLINSSCHTTMSI